MDSKLATVIAITTKSLDDSLMSEWQALFASLELPRFYHHPDWYRAINEYLVPGSLSVAVARLEDASIRMILPLQGGVRLTTHTPHHDHLPLGGIIFDQSASASEAVEMLIKGMKSQSGWHQWELHNCSDDQRLSAILDERCTNDKKWAARKIRETAWFELSPKSAPPTGKLKRNLRRLRKQLSEKHQLRFESVSDPASIQSAFEHFLIVEASGWKGESGKRTAIKHNKPLAQFYESLLTPQYEGLTPVINLLFADDICIAAQYGMLTHGCLSLIKIGYLEAYSHYSPGSLILEDCLAHCLCDGIQTLSLVTAPTWADRWHPKTAPVWHITRYNNTSTGNALRIFHSLKSFAKRHLQDAA